VIIPPRPGVLSTWGLLDTDIRATFVRTVGTAERRLADGATAFPALETVWRDLETQARAWLGGEQVPAGSQRFERSADLRYEHQSFELTCALGDGALTAARLEELATTFHAEHRRLYTYDLPSAPIELVNLRVTAIGALPKRAEPAPASTGGAPTALRGRRQVYFRGTGFTDTPCYGRDDLPPGTPLAGPAIVDQDDTTVLVTPGFRARMDRAGNLIVERA